MTTAMPISCSSRVCKNISGHESWLIWFDLRFPVAYLPLMKTILFDWSHSASCLFCLIVPAINTPTYTYFPMFLTLFCYFSLVQSRTPAVLWWCLWRHRCVPGQCENLIEFLVTVWYLTPSPHIVTSYWLIMTITTRTTFLSVVKL